MVDVSVQDGRVVFEVEGWGEKLLAMKSRLEIPLEHVTSARVDNDAAKGWWHGFKLAGGDVPGLITAGTFFRQGRLVFYDTHAPEHTILVELNHEHYDRLILQVRDPDGAVRTINAAVKH